MENICIYLYLYLALSSCLFQCFPTFNGLHRFVGNRWCIKWLMFCCLDRNSDRYIIPYSMHNLYGFDSTWSRPTVRPIGIGIAIAASTPRAVCVADARPYKCTACVCAQESSNRRTDLITMNFTHVPFQFTHVLCARGTRSIQKYISCVFWMVSMKSIKFFVLEVSRTNFPFRPFNRQHSTKSNIFVNNANGNWSLRSYQHIHIVRCPRFRVSANFQKYFISFAFILLGVFFFLLLLLFGTLLWAESRACGCIQLPFNI